MVILLGVSGTVDVLSYPVKILIERRTYGLDMYLGFK